MKKFNFSLQTPLDVARSEEKSIKSKLSAARARLRQLELELCELEKSRKASQEKLSEKIKKDMTASDLLNYHYHIFKLKNDIESYKKRIREENEKCEIILRGLIEVKRRIKMLETLKENKYSSYLKEIQREEAKQLEDFLNGKAVNI